MNLWEDPHFRWYCYGLFAVYALIGLVGTVWISDEFDYIRLTITTYVTVPALCVFLVCFLDDPQYWQKWPKVFWGCAAVVLVTLLWSHGLLLNAICGARPLVLSHSSTAMTVNAEAKRGAFGWIYTTRW